MSIRRKSATTIGARVGPSTRYASSLQATTFPKTSDAARTQSGVELADGWYCGIQAWCYQLKGRTSLNRYKPDFILQLEVEYADGTRETLLSDASWKFSYGARLDADIYNGEKYDARREFGAWVSADFDDSSWRKPAVEQRSETPLIEPRRCEPILCTDTFKPVSIRKNWRGRFHCRFRAELCGH